LSWEKISVAGCGEERNLERGEARASATGVEGGEKREKGRRKWAAKTRRKKMVKKVGRKGEPDPIHLGEKRVRLGSENIHSKTKQYNGNTSLGCALEQLCHPRPS